MSARTIERRSAVIAAAFRDADVPAFADGAGRWSLAVPGWPPGSNARIEDDWLVLDAPLPGGPEPRSPWELLGANASFSGPAKFALPPDGAPRIRAEVPLVDAGPVPDRVRAWLGDLAMAADPMGRGPGAVAGVSAVSDETGHDRPSARESLGPACEAAGWPFTECSATRLRVTLGVAEGFHPAYVDVHVDGTVRTSVELARFERLSPPGRDALGTLLLVASGLIRLARAAVVADGDEETTALFEVRLAPPLGEGDLDHALSALAAAARLCGREVDALRRAPLARTFLRIHESGSHAIRLIEAPHPDQEDRYATE